MPSRRSSQYSEVSDGSEGEVASSRASSLRRSIRQSVASVVTLVEERIEVGTVAGTTLNTMCNVIGAGVLALPLAFSRLGIFTGFFLCLLMCVDSVFSAYVLFVACERSGEFFMNSVFAAAVLGKRPPAGSGQQDPNATKRVILSTLVDVAVCVYTYLVLTVYCGLMADSATSVVKQFADADSFWVQRWPWIVISSVIFFVLTSARNMSELKWSSLLGIATIGWAIVVVIAKYCSFGYQGSPAEAKAANLGSPTAMAPSAISVFAVAFGYHVNAPIFYHELQDRSPTKMMRTVKVAFPLILVAYVAIGCIGYLSFGDAVKGIIVDDYGDHDSIVNSVRVGLFFHFACVYPVISVCLRQTAHRVALTIACRREEAESPDMVTRQPRWLIFVEAFIIVSTTSFITYIWTDIGKMVSIIGSLTGTHFIMTVPGIVGMCVWTLSEDADAVDQRPLVVTSCVDPPTTTGGILTGDDMTTMKHPPLWEWRRVMYALCALNVVMGVVLSVVGLASDLELFGS